MIRSLEDRVQDIPALHKSLHKIITGDMPAHISAAEFALALARHLCNAVLERAIQAPDGVRRPLVLGRKTTSPVIIPRRRET